MKDLFVLTFRNLAAGQPHAELFCTSLLHALLVSVLTVTEGVGETRENPADEPHILGSRIKDYIDRHYMEPITLQSMGEALRISPYYLSHVFKQMSGYSPVQYLLRRPAKAVLRPLQVMLPQQLLCLLPQFIADGLHHHGLFHQIRQCRLQFCLHNRFVGQIRRGAPGALSQQLHIFVCRLFLTQTLTPTGAGSGKHQTARERILPIVWAAFSCASVVTWA